MENYVITSILSSIVISLISYAVKLFWDKNRAKDLPEPEKGRQKTVDDLIALYGEPDDFVLLDATRGNEAAGVLLVYDSAGHFVINGEKIRKNDIVDVTFNNIAIPYFPNEYQVIFKLKNEKEPLHIPVGHDVKWALQVVEQIKYHWEKLT